MAMPHSSPAALHADPPAAAAARLPTSGSAVGRFVCDFEHYTTQLASASAVAMLALAVFCGLWQVGVRFIFNTPSEWTEVLTRFALIWMVYLGVTLAIREGAMVCIDLCHRLLPPPWRRALEVFILAATLALMALLFWQGLQVSWRIRFQEAAGLGISMSWAYLAIPVGAAFAAIAAIAHFIDPRRNELENSV
jgi:TRAP-type C4-dicarboxylate transport system permease small subunit